MFDPLTTTVAIDNPIPSELTALERRLVSIQKLGSWLAGRRAAVVAEISRIENERNPRSSERRTRDRVKKNSGCSSSEANRETKNAEQLGDMGSTSEGLREGRIPVANAQALARLRGSLAGARRAAFDEAEDELARLAERQSPDEFRVTLRDWAHAHSDDDGIDDAQRRRDRRRLSLSTGDDEMGLIRGELDPESFEILRRAVTDVANELFHGDHTDHAAGAADISANARLMADAMVELARRGSGVDAAGGRRGRPTVIVTINHRDLVSDLEAEGVTARLADGTPVPAETARRLACEANLVPVVLGGHGEPLDVGRSRRLATSAQRAALRTQYRGCAFKGCGRPFDWCHIHHLHPWQAGGVTDLANLVPLCAHHHRLAHEGGWTAQRQPDGTVLYTKAPPRSRTDQTASPRRRAAGPRRRPKRPPKRTDGRRLTDVEPGDPGGRAQSRTLLS